jgi:hypothetical protein
MVSNDKTFPKAVIQFHRHSRSGTYTVKWFNDERIGWETSLGYSICDIADFKCVHGGLKQVCVATQVFERVMHERIASQMYSLASQYTTDQLRSRYTNGTHIGTHYYLTKLQLI